MSRSETIHDLVQSHRVTAVIHAAAKLDLAEAIGNGTKSTAEIARSVSADESALRRLLVALTTIGICIRADHDKFSMTDLGRQLDGKADPSFKDWALFEGEQLVQSWSGLVDSVRTGKTATQLRGDGDDSYAAMSSSPERIILFDAAMVSLTRSLAPKIVEACDFSAAKVVMDVGGGSGELIGSVLRQNPGLEGIAYDLARCEAEARAHFGRLGIADRCRFVAGDFFEAVPRNADTILMKSIIHNWNDNQSKTILRNCHDALPPGGKLIILERIMPEHPTTDAQDRLRAMSDLNMLRGPGGRERTETEHRMLAESVGLVFARTSGVGSFNLIQFDKVAD
jgi:ubiquinone/menaquinone biosynthesis C-methylase UbiE